MSKCPVAAWRRGEWQGVVASADIDGSCSEFTGVPLAPSHGPATNDNTKEHRAEMERQLARHPCPFLLGVVLAGKTPHACRGPQYSVRHKKFEKGSIAFVVLRLGYHFGQRHDTSRHYPWWLNQISTTVPLLPVLAPLSTTWLWGIAVIK